MLLTWLLPRSPFALSSADPGPQQWPLRGWWSVDRLSDIAMMDPADRILYRAGGSWYKWRILFRAGILKWWWTTIEGAADDGPEWRQWTMTVDYSGIRSWWRIMILLAADHRLWLQQDYAMFTLKNAAKTFLLNLFYTWHLLHFCPSWERDPSHVALSEVSTFFLPC